MQNCGWNQAQITSKLPTVYSPINTNHCSNARLWKEIIKKLKENAQLHILGEEQTDELSKEEIDDVFEQTWELMIKKIGGQDAWNHLPKSEQNMHQAKQDFCGAVLGG